MIGKNLKRIRKVKGLTQDKLSELTNISITSIQRYESGKRQPTIETINKFIEALGVSIEELLYKDGEITEMTTGEKIKYYRKDLNLTQQELANLSGISLRALSNYEKGIRKPSLETAIKISRVLRISPKHLNSNAIMLEEIKNKDISSFNFIGESIRKLRIKNNLTMNELSKKCEISQSYISDLENGKIKDPSIIKIEKISKVLKVSINQLLNQTSTQEMIQNSISKKEIGKNIKLIRQKKNITRKELAQKLNISYSSIEKYEQGLRGFKVETIDKFSKALEIQANEIMGVEDIKINNLAKLQRYYEQKKWEYENIECEHNIGNEGVLKGLEIAINIMVES